MVLTSTPRPQHLSAFLGGQHDDAPPHAPPKPDRVRALELLASCHGGCTAALMIAHGFTIDDMVALVRAGKGFAPAQAARA